MGDITLSFGWFLLLLILACVAILDWLLLPSVRWYFRRRVNRVLEELNRRLPIRLQAFKLTKRQVLIDRLLYDPEVLALAEKTAGHEQQPLPVVMGRVERYAREIVPAFNAYFYFRFGYWLARKLARSFYRVRLGWAAEPEYAKLDPDRSTLVFVMNHRSNMDYVLVTYMAADRTALSYAVGEWARIWPLQSLIRAMGAYFVRRGSGNALYRKVLERYIQMACENGVTQALYPEGGLSRDGRLGRPKLGVLDYMWRKFDLQSSRDIVFIPVGLNYDRVLEDRHLLEQAHSKANSGSEKGATRSTWAFLGRNLWLMLTQRWFRFGYACANFGPPISTRAWFQQRSMDPQAMSREERLQQVQCFADELLYQVGQVVPVTPVALVATCMLQSERPLRSRLELKARAFALAGRLEQVGARVYVPRKDRDYALEVGLRMLRLRHLVVENEDGLYVPEEQREILEYYANSIEHYLESNHDAEVNPVQNLTSHT